MLYYFLQCHEYRDENIFKSLNVAKYQDFCQEHRGKHPVIFFTLKDVKQASYAEAYADILELIRQLYASHRYLLNGDLLIDDERQLFNLLLNKKAEIADVKAALKTLCGYLLRKFGRPAIILIDEYDTPIQEAYLRGYYQEMVDFMRSMFGMALKDNPSLCKAVLTGITRISQESLFSGLNNVEVYSLLREEYGQYFGFTESEVVKLINETSTEASLDKIKEWYNGYQVGKYTLYNPWSIINCLKNHGQLKPYWLNTASNELLAKLHFMSIYALFRF